MLRRLLSSLILCVTFLLIFEQNGIAQESGQVTVTGTLLKSLTAESDTQLKLRTSSGHIYQLKITGQEANETINKLEDGDLISGFGQIDNSTKMAAIQSLSFIGLKRLLGFWWTSLGFVEIQTFSEMNFYQPVQKKSASTPIKKSYQYSVSPSSGPSWVIFLSDDKTVYYTSMEINGVSAKMKMYNPETGALMKTIEFTRINR